ncbi:MAG: discoidin domain-containing protein [Bacteroidota bacterium]|jgi:hypothetical protein|nr:discoidin domain-containing protein [Bacteroidota bacterium]
MRQNIVLIVLIGVIISALGFTSCAPDYQTEFEVKTLVVPDKSLSPIVFPIEGGSAVAEVITNVELSKWSTSSNAAWLTVEKREGQVDIQATRNDTYAPRVGRITIEYGHQAYYINVTQECKSSFMLVEGKVEGVVKSVSSVAGTVEVTVRSNLNVDHVLIPDTAAFIQLESIKNVAGKADEKRVTFKVAQNMARNPRYGTVTFQSSENYAQMASFVIVQEEMVMVKIPLRVDMLSSNAQEPREGPIANLIDGNPSTFFHSLWSGSISEMHYFQIVLDEPIDGCVFWYQNRNNSNGKAQNVSIMVSANGTEWTELIRITSGLPTGAGSTYESAYLAAKAPFKYFRFVVNATNDGQGPRFFNMAEFALYRIKE